MKYQLILLLSVLSISSALRAEQTIMDMPPSPSYFQPAAVSTDFLTGQFSPESSAGFVRVESRYADRKGLYLQQPAYEAFKAMHKAAKQAGIHLQIRSATRNFNAQKSIWEAKWQGKRTVGGIRNIVKALPDPTERALKILEYSSMPGSSRHHWGTEIDLNAFDNSWFERGEGKKLYEWLQQHAASFGFCQPYSVKGSGDGLRQHGYNEEKWHWSYLPLAGPYTEQASRTLSNDLIRGFQGAETAANIDIINHYVMGINPSCRQPATIGQ